MAVDEVKIAKLTHEITSSHHVSAQTPDNPRQPISNRTYSLSQAKLVTVQKFKQKIRQPTTEYQCTSFRRLAKIKEDPFAETWRVRRRQLIPKPNSTGKPELAEGWRLNLSAFPLKRAPHAKWTNKSKERSSFYYSLTWSLSETPFQRSSISACANPPYLLHLLWKRNPVIKR